MTLTSEQVTIIADEISNDPQALGYSGQSNAQIASIMNVSRVSPTPIMVYGWQLTNIISETDGAILPNNGGVGLTEFLLWLESTYSGAHAEQAVLGRYYFNAATQFDITHADPRNNIDYLSGVELNQVLHADRQLFSDDARTEMYLLGEYQRSIELIGREITEAEVVQALG